MASDERFERCMKLADFWAARYYARLQYEWKVTLGLWALLAASASFLIDKTIPYLLAWALAVIVGHAFWLRGIWTANQRNLITAYHWADQAAAVLDNPHWQIDHAPRTLTSWERSIGFLGNWSMAFQLGATTILVILGYALSGSKIAN
jgi:ABC-type multidrug transport system fused ATPase/permease subunit